MFSSLVYDAKREKSKMEFTVISFKDELSPKITKEPNKYFSVFKQIECHSMGIKDMSKVTDENASVYRKKLAVDIYEGVLLESEKKIAEKEVPEVSEIDKPDNVDFEKVRKKKQEKQIEEAKLAIKLRAGKITTELPNVKGKPYDPFGKIVTKQKKALTEFLSKCKYYNTRKKVPERTPTFFYRILRGVQKHLHDEHIDAVIKLFRSRYNKYPECFRSRRLCFLDTKFSSFWTNYYKGHALQMIPPGSSRYVAGLLPDDGFKSEKSWIDDVDDIYTVLHIPTNHWVALKISIQKKMVYVYDSIVTYASETVVREEVKALSIMVPHMINMLTDDDKRLPDPVDPYECVLIPGTEIPQNIQQGDCGVYSLKYIECDALGKSLKPYLCDKNIHKIREKYAVEIYAELEIKGTEDYVIPKIDEYD